MAILSVTNDLIKAMDEKKISILVLMDMSKGFDSINHDRDGCDLNFVALVCLHQCLNGSKATLKEGTSMSVLEMWFRSLSQLIMEFRRGPFLALFCLLFI